MLINVSRKVPVMLMSSTSRLAVEILVELTGRGSQEWMKAEELISVSENLLFHMPTLLP